MIEQYKNTLRMQ